MTVVLPPTFGKANWTDYTDYWRDADASWLMERSILRYATAGTRGTDWSTPSFGQVTYNESSLGANIDRLEMYSKQHNAWVPLLMLANITSTQDNTFGVALSHKLSGNKGVIFSPTLTVFDNPVQIMSGMLYVDSDSVDIKSSGADTAKLTTTGSGAANRLVSDKGISAPSLTTGGAITAASGTITSLSATNISVSGTVTGGTFSGAVSATTLNASTGGTIGGVALASNYVGSPGGMVAQGAYLRGDSGTGYLSYRNPGDGAVGAPTLTMDATYLRVRSDNGIPFDRHSGAWNGGWVACVYTSDPGAANAPTGSILLQ